MWAKQLQMDTLYLKLLDDFCHTGKVPMVSKIGTEGKPWLQKADPLLDFLFSLMRDTHYQKQILNSRLRAKVFYSAVGKFLAECAHYEEFQRKRAWTERNNMQKVLEWSPVRKADSHALHNLLDEIAARHAGFGFDKAFFETLMTSGNQEQQNWEKLVRDWQQVLDRHIVQESRDHIERRKEDFKTGLRTVMDQVTRYMRTHEVPEQQAIQAWEMMDGQWTETEFERRMNVVRVQDRYPEIKEIAARMGRTADNNGRDRLAITSGISMKMEHSSGSDIEGITIGSDLNALLPIELAQYSDDEMSDLFMHKYLTKHLQTFRYKSEMSKPSRKLGFTHASRRGPIIACLDTSASMYGLPQRITSSLLALLEDTAEQLGRDCFLIDFSVSIRPIDLMQLRRDRRMMNLGVADEAKEKVDKGNIPFIGGGTSARKLLEELFRLLDDECGHYVNADVLLVSDFLIPMPEYHYLTRLKSYRETGTKLYGLSIKAADDKEQNDWKPMFDHIWDIRYRQVKRY